LPSAPPFSPAPTVESPKGKSYSSGSGSSATPGKKPAGGPTFDPGAAAAARQEESRKAYTKGTQPRTTYTDPSGTPRPTNDQQVRDLRERVERNEWVNRPARERTFAERYRVSPPSSPVVVYRDPYSNLFWWWLLTQTLDQQARWAYHHRHTMDEARYQELLRRNEQLAAKVNELERENVPRDPTYVPPDVPTDLMYTDTYVDAAYNPEPVPWSLDDVFWTFVQILGIVACLAFLYWIVFVKWWGGTE
jgi:hypothetical protein